MKFRSVPTFSFSQKSMLFSVIYEPNSGLHEKSSVKGFFPRHYSQTGCSFDGNIGILVDSLSRASCSVHLVPDGKNLLRFSKIFQYFEDRFASFNVNEPLHEQLPRYSRLRGKICTVCRRCFEM